MKEFLSIKEFSNLTGVETSTLRFWDEIGLFSPAKRDPENNYRYYTLAQATTVNFISVLSDLHLPLKEIVEFKEQRDPEKFMKLLERKERELDMELRALRERSSYIHTRRELIGYGLRVDENEITILPREDKAFILWPRNKYTNDEETYIEPLAAFINKVDDYRINLKFPVGGFWDSLQSFFDKPSQPDRFISVDPVGNHIRKEGDYLIGFTRGYYGDMGDLPSRMEEYVTENGIETTGPFYVMYLHDEISTKDPTQYLAQSCVAIAKKGRLKL